MYRRLSAFLAALLVMAGLTLPVGAQNMLLHAGSVKASAPPSGSCAASSAWFARTGTLSMTEHTAQDNLICNMVANNVGCSSWGAGGTMDALYYFSTNSTTNANLNMCSSSFTLTAHGSCTFTADVGYTGDGSTCWFDTGFNPNSGSPNYTLNAASVGAYSLTSRTTGMMYSIVGGSSADGNLVNLLPKWTDNNAYACVNCASSSPAANTNAQGQWVEWRSSSTVTVMRKNQMAFLTDSSTATPGNGFTGMHNLIIMATSDPTFSMPSNFDADQISVVWFGGTMNATNADEIASLVNAAMTTMSINVY